MCINDHAYRCFLGSFLEEYAARKQSEPWARIDNSAHQNVGPFGMDPMGQEGQFQPVGTLVGVPFSRQNLAPVPSQEGRRCRNLVCRGRCAHLLLENAVLLD